jgi:hypothetical protein
MADYITYVWHRGSDTFFALEDEAYLFKAEALSEEALESVEEAGSLRGFEEEGTLITEEDVDNIRGLLSFGG